MSIKNLRGSVRSDLKKSTPSPRKRRKTISSANFCAAGAWGLKSFYYIFYYFIIEFISSINFERKKLKNTSAHYKFLVPRSDEFIKRENDQFRDVLSLSPGSREVRDGEILRAWLGCRFKKRSINSYNDY